MVSRHNFSFYLKIPNQLFVLMDENSTWINRSELYIPKAMKPFLWRCSSLTGSTCNSDKVCRSWWIVKRTGKVKFIFFLWSSFWILPSSHQLNPKMIQLNLYHLSQNGLLEKPLELIPCLYFLNLTYFSYYCPHISPLDQKLIMIFCQGKFRTPYMTSKILWNLVLSSSYLCFLEEGLCFGQA